MSGTAYIGASRMRVTRVDACGRTAYGPASMAVSAGFAAAEISPEIEDGDDVSAKSASGELIVSEPGQPSLKWVAVTVEFIKVDPSVFLLMNPSFKPVTAADRKIVTGWRMGQKMNSSAGFALELWPRLADAGRSCLDEHADESFHPCGYFLLPRMGGATLDSWTLEPKVATFKLKCRSKAGSLWGRGPRNSAYKITRNADGEPDWLFDPIDPGIAWPAGGFPNATGNADHFHGDQVTVAPPEVTDGAVALWNEDAPVPVLSTTGSGGRTVRLSVDTAQAPTGVVAWGDGSSSSIPAHARGTAEHTYAPALDGREQQITFTASTGAAPVSTAFTPTEPVPASAASGGKRS
ncbi:hypothetical protein GCM10010174_03240 [Kutzneria viridogrisea]|uniref:Phage tail protein n=1 Tax=Kutzneria viridogrisea TaxID=47990 RepID=A0ABR6BRW4_9PSEU|nr:hypothetical protein [Kutzneria viridogrisea]